MAKADYKGLMNLPTDVQMLLAAGKYTLYTLPQEFANKGAYLLAMSRQDTFFVSEDGKIGPHAGKLGDVQVKEVVLSKFFDHGPTIRLNIA